jgi:hypothetical protein
MKRSTSAPSLLEKKLTSSSVQLLMKMHKSSSSQTIACALPNQIFEMFADDGKIVPWNFDDIESSIPFVPVQQAIICGSTHSFPLSLLDPSDDHDARSVATCLATPTVRECEESSNVLRRIVNLESVYRRRVLMHKMLLTKQTKQ